MKHPRIKNAWKSDKIDFSTFFGAGLFWAWKLFLKIFTLQNLQNNSINRCYYLPKSCQLWMMQIWLHWNSSKSSTHGFMNYRGQRCRQRMSTSVMWCSIFYRIWVEMKWRSANWSASHGIILFNQARFLSKTYNFWINTKDLQKTKNHIYDSYKLFQTLLV